MEKFNNILEIGFWVSKGCPDTQLAKTIKGYTSRQATGMYKTLLRINHGLNQDLETRWPKLAINDNYLGILFFKGENNILRLQP